MSKTVVIYRMGSLGDTVVALPCLHKIVERFPDHRRILLTNVPMSSKAAPVEAVLRNGGFVDGSISYPYGTRSPARLLAVRHALRSLRAELLVYVGGGRGLSRVYRDLLFFRLCGISKVIGAPTTNDLDRCREDPATSLLETEAARLARCLAALGPIDIDDKANWNLHLTTAEQARSDDILIGLDGAPFIAVNTGGKLPVQDWGEANWRQLLARLAHAVSMPLVFVGGEDDAARAHALAPLWGGPVLNACGLLSPRETAALLSRAVLFVGHESGPMHLAASRGVGCVAVFGGNNPPGKWFPRGDQHRIHYDGKDVRTIAPELVCASILERLSGATAINL